MSAPFGPEKPSPFGFAPVERKNVVAAFDGGRITPNGGVMLLGTVERQLGIADTLAPLISDPRNPLYVTRSVSDIGPHTGDRLRLRGWRRPRCAAHRPRVQGGLWPPAG